MYGILLCNIIKYYNIKLLCNKQRLVGVAEEKHHSVGHALVQVLGGSSVPRGSLGYLAWKLEPCLQKTSDKNCSYCITSVFCRESCGLVFSSERH